MLINLQDSVQQAIYKLDRLYDNSGDSEETTTALKELEKQGIAEVLRPSEHIKISKVEKDPKKLESLYQLGIRDAKSLLADKHGVKI